MVSLHLQGHTGWALEASVEQTHTLRLPAAQPKPTQLSSTELQPRFRVQESLGKVECLKQDRVPGAGQRGGDTQEAGDKHPGRGDTVTPFRHWQQNLQKSHLQRLPCLQPEPMQTRGASAAPLHKTDQITQHSPPAYPMAWHLLP